jgi:hypothetical protein
MVNISHLLIFVVARPNAMRLAETKRQTPNPSFKMNVEMKAAKRTLVSLSPDTIAIGATANAHTMIQ